MTDRFPPVCPATRILMGPGPSDVPSSVLRAMSAPALGYMDPQFLGILDELRVMLRAVFETRNPMTLALSGTGTAGMEGCLVNLVEPGDRVLVASSGYFGQRLAEVARRCGAEVTMAETTWGRAVDPDTMRAAAAGRSFKLLCAVHTETSAGVQQDLSTLRAVADELGALTLVDAVASLGGASVATDANGLDVVYSGSQKCLSCASGAAPVTFSPRAVAAIEGRRAPLGTFYFDLLAIARYWGEERAYHHTPPASVLYGLHEALRLILAEGLDERFRRTARLHAALVAGLEALGLELPVPAAERSPTLTVVGIPGGVDDLGVRSALLAKHGLEIGAGLGPLKGRAWRIGLLGESATRRNVVLCLAALGAELATQGWVAERDPVAAAEAALAQET